MPQVRKIDDAALIERLGQTFKDVGYEGASLSALASATGLGKSSLYHRFPDGKEQMAEEVLSHIQGLLNAAVFPILEGQGTPREKVERFASVMNAFYASGAESCLLNTLCPPRGVKTSRGTLIEDTFHRLLQGLGRVAREAGADEERASRRAEQALVELQGSLVVARGTGNVAVFERMLVRLPEIILGPTV